MASPIPVLGVIGGIGSGKSTVAAELARHGGWLINADHLGHEALRQPEIQRQVVERFGADIVAADGAIDRRRLGAKVFADVNELRALEALVFPFIGRRIRETIAEARCHPEVGFIILDAAVMLEAGWNDVCAKVIFVEAPDATRLARVQRKRGWSHSELETREARQLPLDVKRRRADAVIVNDGAVSDLAPQVKNVLARWNLPITICGNDVVA